jgi:hypothetical protein
MSTASSDPPGVSEDAAVGVSTDLPSEAALRQEILRGFEEFESSFRKNYPVVWLATLIGPLVLTLCVVLLLGLLYGWGYAGKVVSYALATFFFFGRFVILGGKNSSPDALHQLLSPEQLFAMVTYMDLMVAVLLSFHIGFAFKLPVLGPKISDLVADGRFILSQHPWMRRMTFLGLIAFVTFPLAATGSVGGSIFGRLLGMGRLQTLIGIFLGSVLGNGLMYFGSELIGRYIDKDDPLTTIGGIAVVAAIIILLERRYRKMKQAGLADLRRDGV